MEESVEFRDCCFEWLSVLHDTYGSEAKISKAIYLTALHNPLKPDAGGDTASFAFYFRSLFSTAVRKPLYIDEDCMEVIKDAGEFEIYGRRLKNWSTRLQEYPDTIEQMALLGPGATDSIEMDFWDSLQIGRLWRRMMETGKGYIGMAHAQSQVGDSIVLLAGASVPIILRPCEGGYRVIGVAYVHGIMDGEIWDAQDEIKMQEFHIT